MAQPQPLVGQTAFNDIPEEANEPIVDENEGLAKVIEAYDSAKKNQEGLTTLWVKLWNLWRFYRSAQSTVKIFDPIGFAMTAGLLSKIFVRTPKIILTARDGGWKWLAKLIQSYLERQFANPDSDDPMEEEYISFVTELLVLGTAVGKTSWYTKYITQYEDQLVTDEAGNVTVKRIPVEKKAFDDPIFEHIPLESFLIQPGAKTISEARYCMFEKYCDKSYLEELKKRVDEGTGQPIYDVAKIDEVLAGGSDERKDSDEQEIEEARRSPDDKITTEQNKDKFHIIEYWENDQYIVVLNKSAVIRGPEDNPNDDGKKPFIAMSYTKVPHQFWGIGAIEPTSDLQKAQNITLTQRIEYVSNLLNQQFSVLSGRDVDEDALIEGYPVVHTASHDAIQALEKGSIPQASFLTAQDILGSIERTMGISGYQVGAPQAADDKTNGTMGGIQTIVTEAQTRFDFILRRFENIVVKGIAKRFLDLDRQYFPETEQKLILVNTDNQQISAPLTKELLQAADFHIDIMPNSTGVFDKNRKSQSFMAWTQFAVGMIPNFNREAAVLEAADYQDIENPERFITQMVPGQMPSPVANEQTQPQP